MEWMPLMKGTIRVKVRSEDSGEVSEARDMVSRGT
jgi:hypothetical protein